MYLDLTQRCSAQFKGTFLLTLSKSGRVAAAPPDLQNRFDNIRRKECDCTELQIQERRQTRRHPGMQFARVHPRSASSTTVARHSPCPAWADFRGKTALLSAPDSAQLRGFVGIGVKETQTALAGSGAADPLVKCYHRGVSKTFFLALGYCFSGK